MNVVKRPYITAIFIIILIFPLLVQAQFKAEIPNIPGLNTRTANGSPSFFGIDLADLNFQHSYSMQVSSFGNDAVAMGLLKTSFEYTINPQVSFQGSVGLMHSPFSSITPMGEQYSFLNGFSADNIFYSGEVTYKPKENMSFQIGFSRMPVNTYNRYYSPYPYRRLGY
ncbi:MAG: hypothetical protein HN995_12800 [Candidatus Marinimicrobia bacterium]|jgi:long-subunit fatty acid transport protein|nr:hypothetical protein [Candidatus Neomarinimicrobiota bacterium]MBT3576186.1 hypothetical protein [Candidatus Neomarinimicrobiota bacterium]MBT3680605.1 hypothetical protein [Candidatus Neomarinimicrobiota bacterium]MBT3950896.1 hypothetical protein [Candidatus Neomarinimicrobiota bacterium]MBT4251893.1 hypothetical protein [Candidatus Neomarinimicrobiota bacterium]